jgi:uncharacterized delta-60 repeat protein
MKKTISFLVLFLFASVSFGQSLQLDPAFNGDDVGFDYAGIPNNYSPFIVRCSVEQPDGKIIIGGYYNTYNNTTLYNKPIRLNADGTIDSSFNFNTVNINAMEIKAMVLQSDGKIIFIGNFSFYYATTSYNGPIFRLNSDGSFDTGFNPNFSPSYQSIYDGAVQPDGKIILVGKFTSSGTVTTNCIARINTDGTLDTSFNPGGAGPLFGLAPNAVNRIKLQPDGKIIIAGNFGAYNGVARKNIARLNEDGTLDLSFNPGTGFDELGTTSYPPTLNSLALQADGKLLVGGKFVGYNGLAKRSIVRINTDGSADTGFQIGLGASYTFQGASGNSYDYPAMVRAVAVQANGKIVLGGFFERFNGINQNNITRLNSDGTLDATFNSGMGMRHVNNSTDVNLESAGIHALTTLASQKILISGQFMRYDNTMEKCLARIDPEGNIDLSFNTVTSFDGTVNCSVVQPDGKVLVGGNFTKYYTENKRGLVRLNTDGSVDSSFAIGSGIYTTTDVMSLSVSSIVIQPDNKIIVSGYFNSFNGVVKHSIVRLNADGSIDTGFTLAPTIVSQMTHEGINKVILQPDGKILVVLDYVNYLSRMYRLNPDGSLDSTFSVVNYASNVVFLLPDGKILFAESSSNSNRLKRLNANGTVDTSFPTVVFSNDVYSIDVQSDGKIIVAGSFSNVSGSGVPGIARLNADGTLDVSFYLTGNGSTFIGKITVAKAMPNGKFLIAGNRDSSPSDLAFLYTLNSGGAIETSFSDSQIGGFESLSSTEIYDINIQDSEYIYIGGSFTSFGTDGRNRFARLQYNPLSTDDFNRSADLKLYPNPTKDFLNIDVKADCEISEMQVFNVLGQSVIFAPNLSHEKTLDVTDLKAGTYFIKVNTNYGTVNKGFIKN